jgi:hypothetical protein
MSKVSTKAKAKFIIEMIDNISPRSQAGEIVKEPQNKVFL